MIPTLASGRSTGVTSRYMFDVSATDPTRQRARGRAAVAIGPGNRLERLAQAGSAKAMLPKMHGAPPEIVFLNTAGGLTGGDRLDYEVALAGGQAVATTQTAERIYRSARGEAVQTTRIKVGPGATLHWLPQETIFFEKSALSRVLEVDLADDATFLTLETLVLGRAAMGETVRRMHLRDRRVIRRAGRPVLVEGVFLNDAELARPGSAGLGGARAVCSLSYLAADAEDRLVPVRAALEGLTCVRAAASAWDGRLTARFKGNDAHALRRAAARVITTLSGQPLPRVWQL